MYSVETLQTWRRSRVRYDVLVRLPDVLGLLQVAERDSAKSLRIFLTVLTTKYSYERLLLTLPTHCSYSLEVSGYTIAVFAVAQSVKLVTVFYKVAVLSQKCPVLTKTFERLKMEQQVACKV